MEGSTRICSTFSWKLESFVANLSIWSHPVISNCFNNGHSEICTPRQNHLSFGILRSSRRVNLGKTNLAAASATSSRETISSTPQFSIRRSSNCMSHLATDAGNKLFKISHSKTLIFHRFWKLKIPWGSLFHTCFIFGRRCNFNIFTGIAVTACVSLTSWLWSSNTSCSEPQLDT